MIRSKINDQNNLAVKRNKTCRKKKLINLFRLVFKDICGCHTKMIEGNEKQLTEIVYTNINYRAAV